MAVRAPLAPNELLKKFLDAGWRVVDEGMLGYLLAPPAGATDVNGAPIDGEPFHVPKDGDEVTFDIMDKARRLLGARGRW